MEVLRRTRGIGDDEISFGAELEISLESCAGVLRPLPLISVRQEQDKSGVLAPLGAVRDQELVHDRLRHVGKVAELRLPEHKIVRRGRAEAVLEAHDSGLRERAVVNLERTA